MADETKALVVTRVAEVLDDGDGIWRACSGCQESSDGCVSTRDYPYSDVFRCQPGGGCRECGGIGVIWDTTDYEDFANWSMEQDAAEQSAASKVAELEADNAKLREAVTAFLDLRTDLMDDIEISGDLRVALEEAFRTAARIYEETGDGA